MILILIMDDLYCSVGVSLFRERNLYNVHSINVQQVSHCWLIVQLSQECFAEGRSARAVNFHGTADFLPSFPIASVSLLKLRKLQLFTVCRMNMLGDPHCMTSLLCCSVSIYVMARILISVSHEALWNLLMKGRYFTRTR